MKALELMQRYWDQVTGYLMACRDLPWSATACRPLWSWVATGSMAVGALCVLWAVWKVIDYKIKYRAAVKAEEHRQYIPPPEEMEKVRWIGDDRQNDVLVDPDEDIAARIREEIARRKLQEKGLLPPRKP